MTPDAHDTMEVSRPQAHLNCGQLLEWQSYCAAGPRGSAKSQEPPLSSICQICLGEGQGGNGQPD